MRQRYSFSPNACAKNGSPAAAPIAERVKAVREAHAAGIYTWVKIAPAACPAELIDVVESLRADVDAWKIGKPLPGEPPIRSRVGGRYGFVDADTALAYLHRMVERGLSDKLHNTMDEMKIWSPDQDKGKSGGARKEEG